MSVTIFRSEATKILSEIRKNSTFLTVHHYVNNFGEISDYSIAFHVNYLNAVQRAKNLLEAYQPTSEDCLNRPYTVDHLRVARDELIPSFGMTIDGYNPLATSADAYEEIMDQDKVLIPGVKLHKEQDILHLWGFRLHKRVVFPGNYPKDNRQLKTIAKDELRSMSPLGRFGQFKLMPGKFMKFVVEGLTVKERDVIRESLEKLQKWR